MRKTWLRDIMHESLVKAVSSIARKLKLLEPRFSFVKFFQKLNAEVILFSGYDNILNEISNF